MYRIGVVILFFFKAQMAANSLRLLAKFETQKKGKRTSQNGFFISLQFLKAFQNFVLILSRFLKQICATYY